MLDRYIVSYAQNREDIILSAFFDEDYKGFYVDVGANDPVHESVTKFFYDRGWEGINIEPLPHQFEKLVKKRSRDINLNIGISDKEGVAKLNYYPNGDGLSTISKKMKSSYEKNPDEFTSKVEVISIRVSTLRKVFEENLKANKISFLKIDVEGLEYKVLAGNDWFKYRPEIICIEANHIEKSWQKFLTQKEYIKVFFDGVNEYYADNYTKRAINFDYVHGVIFKEPIVNFRLINYFKQKDGEVIQLRSRNEALSLEVIEVNKELQYTQTYAQSLINEIESITPLKKHIKKHIKFRLKKVDNRISAILTKKNLYSPGSVEKNIDPRLIHMYDVKNFELYNQSETVGILYRFYGLFKKAIIKMIKLTKG